jgi:hypothetical protein
MVSLGKISHGSLIGIPLVIPIFASLFSPVARVGARAIIKHCETRGSFIRVPEDGHFSFETDCWFSNPNFAALIWV